MELRIFSLTRTNTNTTTQIKSKLILLESKCNWAANNTEEVYSMRGGWAASYWNLDVLRAFCAHIRRLCTHLSSRPSCAPFKRPSPMRLLPIDTVSPRQIRSSQGLRRWRSLMLREHVSWHFFQLRALSIWLIKSHRVIDWWCYLYALVSLFWGWSGFSLEGAQSWFVCYGSNNYRCFAGKLIIGLMWTVNCFEQDNNEKRVSVQWSLVERSAGTRLWGGFSLEGVQSWFVCYSSNNYRCFAGKLIIGLIRTLDCTE